MSYGYHGAWQCIVSPITKGGGVGLLVGVNPYNCLGTVETQMSVL